MGSLRAGSNYRERAMTRTLTLQTLIDKGACSEQVELFRATFGESVRVTQRLCVSVADAFSWPWAARHLLSAPASAEYERVTAPAWAEYKRVTAAARAEYERVTARTFAKLYNGDKS